MPILKRFSLVLVCIFFSVAGSFGYARGETVPAFPGAVGYGSDTIGGRLGAVIEVTNLKPEGDGSLRQACEASGPRIIVFRTGGTIKLDSNIRIDNPYLTIAGQTAPGDGITIRGAALTVVTHDVVIRHIRIRVGDALDGPNPENRDALQIESGAYNVVIDHCSFSWAVDEILTFWDATTRDCTINHCIISEALHDSIHPSINPHSKGSLVDQGIRNVSYIGNLFAHNYERNPQVRFTTGIMVNNVVYDRGFRDIDIHFSTAAQSISIKGNVFKKGVSEIYNSKSIYIRDGLIAGTRIYSDDNDCSSYNSGSCIDNQNTAFNPLTDSPPVWPERLVARPSGQVMGWVLANVGARPSNRDPVDVRVISQVRNGTGKIIDSQKDVGGWPELQRGASDPDGDHDGMPDAWENRNGLKPNDPDDRNDDRDGDGYTNIEEYLNFLAGDNINQHIPSAPKNLMIVK